MVTRREQVRRPPAARSRDGRSPRSRPLEAAIRHFRELFEHATDIIIVNDRDGRIVAANLAARTFAGYTLQDVERGIFLRDVLPADECEAALIITRRALDDLPIPEVYEREAVLRDGSRRVLELRSSALRYRGRPYALQTIGRDVTEKKDAAAFQASLLQVSQALLRAPDLDHLGQVICEAASRILHVDGAYLWLRRGEELVGCAAAGTAARQVVGLRRALHDSVIGQIYRAADALVVNEFPHSLYAVPESRTFGVQSMLAVPLRRKDPPVGVLIFTDSVNPRRFTGMLRDRALILGAQTTVAIESALAREREEEEAQITAALLQVARAIRESLEEAELLHQIAGSTRQVLQSDWVLVALWGAEKNALHVAATDGWPADAIEELNLVDFRLPGSTRLRGLARGETVEVSEPPASRGELYARWAVSSFLAVPMMRGNRLIGSVVAGYRQRRGPFSTRERRLVEGIAAQAAVAVDNARLVEDLRRANQLKSEFLSTMSHELRTPLSAILGYTELMRDGAMGRVGREQSRVLDRMIVNGRGLLELINMTLDVNRLEAGRVTVESSDFGLEDLLNELRNEFAVRVADGRLAMLWPTEMEVPPLSTDRGKLKVVIRNLVDNALKFTPSGSVQVGVRCNLDLDRVYLSVRDTGIGIAPEAQAHIFDMFRQLSGTRSSSRGGVGLGLYLVRRYTELLGGEVAVESRLAQGSIFTVDIPRQLRV